MKIGLTIVFLAIAATLCGEDLPRKSKTPRESYPNVDVIYDSVTAPDGKRLRTIITKSHDSKGKLPVIFVAGWLSCDSVEAPAGRKDESGLVFRGLAQVTGFAFFRMDKRLRRNGFRFGARRLPRGLSRTEEVRFHRH